MRLSRLLSDYRDRDIHWLKIDAEGMERAVIQSWRPAKARPWIVVVESTKPNSPEPGFADWEPLFVELGYEFVYFDGLNRFYVNRKHPELKKHFGPGPNVFDDFALSGKANAPFCARINAEAASLREQAAARADEAAQLRSQVAMQVQTFAKAVAVWDGAHAVLHDELAKRDKHIEDLTAWAKSLQADLLARTEAIAARDAELARTREALTASDAWAKSLEADVLARNEALAARDAELARTREALTASDAWAKSLEVDLLARTEALAAVYASKSFRITAPLRSASRAARWFVRGSWAWLTLRPGSRPRRVARRLQMMLSPTDRSRTEIPDLVQDTPDENMLANTSLTPIANLVQSDHSEDVPANTPPTPIQNFAQDNHDETMPANTSPTTTLKIFQDNHNTEALTDLSSSARSVYAELKAAIALHEGSR